MRLFARCNKAIRHMFGKSPSAGGIAYWKDRAERYGVKGVDDLRRADDTLDGLTELHRKMVFPLLREYLSGDERLILDFGCGPGRVTRHLAEMIGGRAIGVDPVQKFIQLAPKGESVEFRVMTDHRIPLVTAEVDAVWCCLALLTISDKELPTTLAEISRVLRPGGLLFVCENTTDMETPPIHFVLRPVATYIQLLGSRFSEVRRIGEYDDMGQTVSLFVGCGRGVVR